MKLLKDKIINEGRVLSGDILKVDQFLNHQIDPRLMNEIGKKFADLFEQNDIDKVVTIETSGIAPALMAGLHLNVPVIFARKHKSLTVNDDIYTADVYSYTKQTNNKISINKRFIQPNDNLLIIDDFLANGQAVKGLIDIASEAKANPSGIGIVIEKSFQHGREFIEQNNIPLHSLARIKSLDNGKVNFVDDDN